MIPRILIVNDKSDLRSGGLAGKLRRRGAWVATAPLATIAFDTERPAGLAIPGFDGGLPDAVLVRSIAAGSFEAVTRRLGVLHALARLSVPVWNSAQAIERCVDKSMTTFLLKNAGLPTPPTFAVEGLAAAAEIAARELARTPLVLKPLFGAQGRGIRMIRALSDLPGTDEVNDVYYLQHYVPRAGPPFRDFRIFVCAGKPVAMMSRRGADWITNVNRGAVPELVPGHDRSRAGGARSRRGKRRRRGFRRRRHRGGSGRPPVRARGQQHAGLVGAAIGRRREHRRCDRRGPAGVPGRSCRQGRVANCARIVSPRRRIRELMLSRRAHPGCLRRGVPARNRGAEAGQCSSLCRRPRHAGRPVPRQRTCLLRAAHRSRSAASAGAFSKRSARHAMTVGTNTNLGIILLCAPLARAAEMAGARLPRAISARSSTGWTSKTQRRCSRRSSWRRPAASDRRTRTTCRAEPKVHLARSDARGRRTRPDRPPIRHPLRRCVPRRARLPSMRRCRAARAACGRPSSPTWRFSAIFRTVMWRASTATKSQAGYESEAIAVRASLDDAERRGGTHRPAHASSTGG